MITTLQPVTKPAPAALSGGAAPIGGTVVIQGLRSNVLVTQGYSGAAPPAPPLLAVARPPFAQLGPGGS